MTGYCQDVTDLRRSALRLEAAAVEWSETFDAMADAVALLDGEGRVVRCNAATLELTGLCIDDIVGHRCDEVLYGAGVIGSIQQQAFETGQAQSNIIEQDHKWLRLSCRPQVDACGRVKGGVLVASDISPLRRAEESARERSHFLEQLLKAVPVPVYCLDSSRRIVGYNQAYSTWFGLAEGERIGGTVYDSVPAALAERFDAQDKELLTRPDSVGVFETELPGPDGTPRYTLSHKAVFSDVSGKPAGIVGVILDVTQIRRVEQELSTAAGLLEVTLEGAVSALGTTTELRDPFTAGHQRRVAQLCTAIAVKLGWDEARTELLDMAGRMHDVGKVVVPAEILAKPGPLSEAEMQIIRGHSAAGAEIVGAIGLHPDVAKMIRQHHERLDGSGYPDGLVGADILAETLILSVADVVEAMISHRPYRPGLPIEAAVAELRAGAGLRYEGSACEAAISLLNAKGFKVGSSLTF
jgi:PAS domain S-box-containing protein/putative nucleotidyltransferase with HDIG domain